MKIFIRFFMFQLKITDFGRQDQTELLNLYLTHFKNVSLLEN